MSSNTNVHLHKRKSSRDDSDISIHTGSDTNTNTNSHSPHHNDMKNSDEDDDVNVGVEVEVVSGVNVQRQPLVLTSPPPIPVPASAPLINSNSNANVNGMQQQQGLGMGMGRHGHTRSSSISGFSYPQQPQSAGPYQTSFGGPSTSQGRLSAGYGGLGPASASPYRSTFGGASGGLGSGLGGGLSGGHSRHRSVSAQFAPSQPSPLSSSFGSGYSNGQRYGHTLSPGYGSQGLGTPTSNSVPNFVGPGLGQFAPPPLITSSKSLPLDSTSISTSNSPSSNPNANGETIYTNGTGTTFSLTDPPKLNQNQSQNHNRRHSRLHSRNLSIFFPRPGSLPASSIAEDGSQELELGGDIEAPVSDIPSAGSSVQFPSRGGIPHTPLGVGFTFGGGGRNQTQSGPIPPSMSGGSGDLDSSGNLISPGLTSANSISGGVGGGGGGGGSMSAKSRRGHHHKHSMSHSFFSFLEPGSTSVSLNGHANAIGNGNGNGGREEEDLHTTPTPIPISPWTPGFGLDPKSSSSIQSTFPITPSHSQSSLSSHSHSHSHSHLHSNSNSSYSNGIGKTKIMTLIQFLLGAWLWIAGQRIGSLSCTGIGYWIVFDSFGVYVGKVLPFSLSNKGGVRRGYGNARIVTVAMFAQAVYLMFASVYVCKETIEHVLLTTGGDGEGHHHHIGEDDDFIGIEFPPLMTLVTFFSVMITALMFDNHSKIVDVTGNFIPSLSTIIQSLTIRQSRHTRQASFSASLRSGNGSGIGFGGGNRGNSVWEKLIENPYVFCPLTFCFGILVIAWGPVPITQHRSADLLLASIIALTTFKVSYEACLVLGTVLLQTAPKRGLGSGKMEAFLRVMREVERHPNVVHLPAPHFWQLTPASTTPSYSSPPSSPSSTSTSFEKDNMNGGEEGQEEKLVVTLTIHVREDLGDDEILMLTKWTWERCVRALSSVGYSGSSATTNTTTTTTRMGMGMTKGVEVSVGVVKG